ncbi:MAG: NDP-sugar synthase [Candidatus Thorarchaeota archaeon]|nr:NDP-sugar synthase [Candidatus Thorarchaeota archaeon]
MHAVILAAGQGSRMSGITRASPKTMIRLAGMTILERLILSLRAAGLGKITVGCGWQGNEIIDMISGLGFGESLFARRITNYEIGPLQTLVTLLDTVDERSFLACPADYLVDPSLVFSFLSRSSERNSHTLCLAVDAERSVGSRVYVREDGSIAQIGGQNRSEVKGLCAVGVSTMLLAGGTEVKNEFRRLLEAGETSVRSVLNEIASSSIRVYPVPVSGFWHDFDTISDVLSVLPKLIDEASPRHDTLLVKSGDGIEFGDTLTLPSGITIESNVQLIGPVCIEESRIGSGSRIGPNVSIGKGTYVPSHCSIDNSVLYGDPKLEQGLHITNMVAHSAGRMFGDTKYAKQI